MAVLFYLARDGEGPPFWDHFGTIFATLVIKDMKIIKHMFFNLFCLVAVVFYLAGDGERGGGPFWDHFGIALLKKKKKT